MSKAFVKYDEDSGEELEWTSEPLLEALGGSKNYMTREGFEDLQAELAELSSRERTREEERRLRLLLQLSELAEVVDVPAEHPDRVIFGSTVFVVTEEDEERSYRIVGISESRPEKGWVSWLSPVAKALLGARVGETVTLKSPKGDEDLTILGIETHHGS